MKKEILDELLKILQEITVIEAVIKEIERFEKDSVFNNLFDSETEIAHHEYDLKILKDKYNELTIKLTGYNYE